MSAKKILTKLAAFPALLILLLVMLPIAAVYTAYDHLRQAWLRRAFRKKWGPEGKDVLLVYSDSPHWKDYIDREMLPKLEPHVVTLNYSERAQWRRNKPLEAKVWESWVGYRGDHNPVAIVIPGKGKVRTVRFHKAFRDFKHGKTHTLRQRESELYSLITAQRG